MLKVRTSSFPIFLSPWIIKLILCHFACYDVTASSSRSWRQRQVGAFLLRHGAGTAEPSHGSVCSMGHVTVTCNTVTFCNAHMPQLVPHRCNRVPAGAVLGLGTVCDNRDTRNRAVTMHTEIQGGAVLHIYYLHCSI